MDQNHHMTGVNFSEKQDIIGHFLKTTLLATRGYSK